MYYRPAIDVNGSIHYIQPPIMSWSFGEDYETVINTPPNPVRKYVLNRQIIGRTLDISGIVHKTNADLARTELETLETFFKGGANGLFNFYFWSDRYYKDCIAEFNYDRTADPSNILKWSARIEINDPVVYSDNEIGPGPYESGVGGGDVETTPTPVPARFRMAVFTIPFDDTLDVAKKFVILPTIPGASVVKLFQLSFLGADNFDGTGDTIIRVNKTGNADGTGLAITIPDTTVLDPTPANIVATGNLSINIGIGEKLYCFAQSFASKPVNLVVGVYVKE